MTFGYNDKQNRSSNKQMNTTYIGNEISKVRFRLGCWVYVSICCKFHSKELINKFMIWVAGISTKKEIHHPEYLTT